MSNTPTVLSIADRFAALLVADAKSAIPEMLRQWYQSWMQVYRELPDLSEDDLSEGRLRLLAKRTPAYAKILSELRQLIRVFRPKLRDQIVKIGKKQQTPVRSDFLNKVNKLLKAIDAYARNLEPYFVNDDWAPDPDAGEDTTEAYEEVREEMRLLKSAVGSLAYVCKDTASEWELDQRRKRLPKVKTKITKPTNESRKRYIDFNQWQKNNLAKLLGTDQDALNKDLDDLASIGVQGQRFRPQAKQKLLPIGVNWGVIEYTVAADAWVGKRGEKLLSDRLFDYQPEYVGGTTHDAIGLNPIHDRGYWYFRGALLLATPKRVDSYDKLIKIMKILGDEDDSLKQVFSHVDPHIDPVYRRKCYYWLLLPKNAVSHQIRIYEWDLVDR